jgi:ABC-2 type transport system permease protein
MQYKISFILEAVGFLLLTGLEFAVIAIIFTRFRSIGGWSIAEVSLLYGLTSIAFSFAEMAARGFDHPFELMMQNGTFDTLLIRPHSGFFQVLTSEFQLRRLGRTLQGLAVLAYALAQNSIDWTWETVTIIPVTIISGTLIYIALMVMGATICFWTIKTPEVLNAFTFGGKELVSYPLSIYNRVLRTLFLSIVPVGFSCYPAALMLLNRRDPHSLPHTTAWLAPIVAILFLGIARLFFQFGVSKYQSTGS